MNIGDFVKVEGISLKGKNRVREFGKLWKVKKIDLHHGTLLESCDIEDNTWRWVANHNDPDFKIVEVINPDNL